MEIFIKDPLRMVRFMEKANISIKMGLYTMEIFILDLFGGCVKYCIRKEEFYKNIRENSARDHITV
jgi:hypothetical protein